MFNYENNTIETLYFLKNEKQLTNILKYRLICEE
jgi:hypothetical protein